MNSAIAHDCLADAQKHFSGHQSQNYFVAGEMAGADFSRGEIHGLNFSNPNQLSFPVAFLGHTGRKFPKAFSVYGTPLPVCFRAGFQFGSRINDRNGKNTLFHFGTEPFENQLKSVLCLVP
jgi:hypothetical protein